MPSEDLTVGFNVLPLGRWAPMFRRLCHEHAGARLRWQRLDAPRAGHSPLDGVDVALLSEPPDHIDVSTLVLKREPRVAVVGASHPLADATEVEVAHLLDEVFPGFDPSIDPRWMSYWFLDRERGGPATVSDDQIATVDDACRVIASGAAITTMPASLAVSVPHPGLEAIPVVDASPASLVLTSRRNDERPLVQALVAIARESVADGERPATCPMCASSEFERDYWDASTFFVCRACGWAAEVPGPL